MSKHTPGPWLSGMPSSIVGWPVIAAGSLGRLICNVAYSDPSESEAKANARLIAEAPETAAERDRLKELNAELLKVMAQACKDLSAIVWTDDALAVRDRLDAACRKPLTRHPK